jgi:predicted phosphate transport protein (TIGR00153 family)
MGLKEWLIPQDKVFFDLLERESANVVEGALQLQDMIENFDNLEVRKNGIEKIEHNGDEIVHIIYERVNATFVTPIDQDDITKLASLYDDVLDYIYLVANRIVLYELRESTVSMKQFARIVRQSVDKIHAAFEAMRRKDMMEIDNRCIEIDSLENEADVILDNSMANLFKGKDVIQIMILKEIYEHLEEITDRCEDVSLELRDIVRRYS